jgi:hypothetical protein
MRTAPAQPETPRWYFIPVRVLLVTFLLTLVSFALSLLFGIFEVVISGRLHGVHPNMTIAYRHIAMPVAAAAAGIAIIAMSAIEIRRYRQAKTLAEIARASR